MYACVTHYTCIYIVYTCQFFYFIFFHVRIRLRDDYTHTHTHTEHANIHVVNESAHTVHCIICTCMYIHVHVHVHCTCMTHNVHCIIQRDSHDGARWPSGLAASELFPVAAPLSEHTHTHTHTHTERLLCKYSLCPTFEQQTIWSCMELFSNPHLNRRCVTCSNKKYNVHVHVYTVPYSRKLSQVKTFTNFAVLSPSTKVLFANFSRSRAQPTVQIGNPWKFCLRNFISADSQKFSPAKVSGYRVHTRHTLYNCKHLIIANCEFSLIECIYI